MDSDDASIKKGKTEKSNSELRIETKMKGLSSVYYQSE